MSEISLGSWLTYGATVDVAGAARRSSQRALELGINIFDTADVYASGAAEEALREALRGVGAAQGRDRDQGVLPDVGATRTTAGSRASISSRASRRRCGGSAPTTSTCISAIAPDETVPLEETVRAYEDLIRPGKVLYWGVSEWSHEQIEAAAEVADRWRAYRPISNQPQYSMLRRGIEKQRAAHLHEREGIGQIVWSPLAQGVLTGKYGDRRAARRHARGASVPVALHGGVPRPRRCSRASSDCGRSPRISASR